MTIKAWQWIGRPSEASKEWELIDGQGRTRAQIWQNDKSRFTWHTYDDCGVGGENSESSSSDDARRHCIASIVIQGWAPCGWRVVR
jgi:hypothetical protein